MDAHLADIAHMWHIPGHARRASGKFQLKSNQIWSKAAQLLKTSAQYSWLPGQIGRLRPVFGRDEPNIGRPRANFCRIRPHSSSSQLRSMIVIPSRPMFAGLGPCSTYGGGRPTTTTDEDKGDRDDGHDGQRTTGDGHKRRTRKMADAGRLATTAMTTAATDADDADDDD